MPTYSLRCLSCRREWEEFAPASARDEIKCCGERAETNFQEQHTRRHWKDRAFVGENALSHRYRFIPQQVKEMQKKMGPYGHCIRGDGRVAFSTRREEQGFHTLFTEKVQYKEQPQEA